MSNICYPEILDSQEAAKGLSGISVLCLLPNCFCLSPSLVATSLSLYINIYLHITATGYIHLFDSVKMLYKRGMEEVLNLLTVSELRTISSTLKKVCIYWSLISKHHIISCSYMHASMYICKYACMQAMVMTLNWWLSWFNRNDKKPVLGSFSLQWLCCTQWIVTIGSQEH